MYSYEEDLSISLIDYILDQVLPICRQIYPYTVNYVYKW